MKDIKTTDIIKEAIESYDGAYLYTTAFYPYGMKIYLSNGRSEPVIRGIIAAVTVLNRQDHTFTLMLNSSMQHEYQRYHVPDGCGDLDINDPNCFTMLFDVLDKHVDAMHSNINKSHP